MRKHKIFSVLLGVGVAFAPLSLSAHESSFFTQECHVPHKPTDSCPPKKKSTVHAVSASSGSFCFFPQPPNPFVLRETDLFGTRMATWLAPNDENLYAFEVFKKTVDSATPGYRLLRYQYQSNNKVDFFVTYLDNQENQLNDILATGNPNVSATFFDGSVHSGPASTVRVELQAYYFRVIDSPENSKFFDFFDENQGFVPAENVYRDQTGQPEEQGIIQGLKIRHDLKLLDPAILIPSVIPPQKPTGDNYRFLVDLKKAHEVATNTMQANSLKIPNELLSEGGGHVENE